MQAFFCLTWDISCVELPAGIRVGGSSGNAKLNPIKRNILAYFSCQTGKEVYNPATMTRKGGINKTRKAVAKRFKVTGSGKVLRRKQGKRHILQKKSSKRKRALGRPALVDETQVWAVKQNMPFA